MTRSHPRQLRSTASIAALALVLLAGCGGDDGSDTTSEARAAFLQSADAICAAGDKKVDAELAARFTDPASAPPRDEQEQFVSEVVAPALSEQLEQLRALPVPAGDQAQVRRILRALAALAKKAANNPDAVLDVEAPPRAARLAQRYGLNSCGGGS